MQLCQGLGDYFRVPQNGHEIRIAFPTWHDMHVQMPRDPGAGDRRHIDPDIESIRMQRALQKQPRGLNTVRQIK